MRYSMPDKYRILQLCPDWDGRLDMDPEAFWYIDTKGVVRIPGADGTMQMLSLAHKSIARSTTEAIEAAFGWAYVGEVSYKDGVWWRFNPANYVERKGTIWEKIEPKDASNATDMASPSTTEVTPPNAAPVDAIG